MKKKLTAFGKELRRNSQLRTGLILLAILLIGAIGAPVFATHDPFALYDSIQGCPRHRWIIFGTDALGRDIFSQVLYGAQTSLKIGVIAASHFRHRGNFDSAASPAISAAWWTRLS